MKKLISLICVITLICVSMLPSLFSNSNIKAEATDLYLEIQKNSWSRAPAKTVYFPVTLGNLNPNSDILVKSIEIFDKDKSLILEEKIGVSLKRVYVLAKSKDEVRKSLGINPPTTEDLDKAKEILLEIDTTKDKAKKNILVEEAWQKLKYKPTDKNSDTYTDAEQKLSNLLYTKWIEIDLTNPAFLWGDWNVTGFRGLEIISNQSNYSSSAVSKWDTLLTNNLQGIINGSYPKIIGMANSDVHNSTYMWGLNMNYIYTGSSSPPGTNRSTVYNNLKAGRVSASSDGSLAVFSLNGYVPGSVVNVSPGTNNISITVSAECARGDYYSPGGTIKIIKNGTAVLTDSFSGLSITRSYTLTATTDCYYRVEVTFNGIVGDHVEYSYCFVNPVYVNLP